MKPKSDCIYHFAIYLEHKQTYPFAVPNQYKICCNCCRYTGSKYLNLNTRNISFSDHAHILYSCTFFIILPSKLS